MRVSVVLFSEIEEEHWVLRTSVISLHFLFPRMNKKAKELVCHFFFLGFNYSVLQAGHVYMHVFLCAASTAVEPSLCQKSLECEVLDPSPSIPCVCL